MSKRKKRLDLSTFRLPIEKMREGYYSDKYFVRAGTILQADNYHPRILMQIFQRNYAVVCGTDEAIAILRLCVDHPEELIIKSLYDGDEIEPYETVMTIEGDYSTFAHLETLYLGVLSRRTRVATNTRRVVEAAKSKPVLFFPARFDHHLVQTGDGYAGFIGGATSVSTDAQGDWWGSEGMGTIPHALIAAYGGDTVLATEKFAEYMPSNIKVISLVDFDNDCVGTSLAVARKLGKRLWGVRLDTSGSVVDKSVVSQMGLFKPTGVNEILVWNVRRALDSEGFDYVKIIVSGGFTPEKIRQFEKNNVPADAYGVGSSLFKNNFDYTADIVLLDGKPCAKIGRQYNPNERLELVD